MEWRWIPGFEGSCSLRARRERIETSPHGIGAGCDRRLLPARAQGED